ncbi:MAG: hypothetical protein ABJB12_18110 [Pseudomonadota bacterium]
MALTVSARARWNAPSAPALIRAAALCAAAGIGLSITEYADTAKWLAVIGVLLMIVGLHRFGRTGPDEPIHFQLKSVRKKKKAKKRESGANEPAPEATDAGLEPPAEDDAHNDHGES